MGGRFLGSLIFSPLNDSRRFRLVLVPVVSR
jgi:hypothetical protein